MLFLIATSVLWAALAGCGGSGTDDGAEVPEVFTESGLLRGIIGGQVDEYLGIPYAAPPVGNLRWMPPKPYGRWPGILQATQFGSVCPQEGGAVTGSENCLFLNVYAPHARKKGGPLLPVMVWIHGGGLIAGSGEIFDPSPLVENGNLIVVTINYRLGLLGFFAHPAIDNEGHPRGNYGLMDQQFALQWVRQNILSFGGNNQLVTIFGQSAGGLSTYCNLASPTAVGLFQRAIVESGSYAAGFSDYLGEIVPVAVAETVGTPLVPSGIALATAVGCPSQTAECLRNVSPANLVELHLSTFNFVYPFIDGTVLTQTPKAAFASGQFNRVPVISGTNHDEFRLFVAFEYDLSGAPLKNSEYATAVDALFGPIVGPMVLGFYPLPANPPADAASLALGAAGTDGIFSCPARLADQSLSRYVTTYAYEFKDENAPLEIDFSNVSFPLGAYHDSEMQYLMNVSYFHVPPSFTPDQQRLSQAMMTYWTNFAKTGDPNSAGVPTWPPYSSAADRFQSLIPPNPTVESSFATDHLCTTFWQR